jgi:hypothetical protein
MQGEVREFQLVGAPEKAEASPCVPRGSEGVQRALTVPQPRRLSLFEPCSDAREALNRYLALPFAGSVKTIEGIKAYYTGMRGDPRFVETNEPAYDGLRKAGMPEGEQKTN